MVNVNDFESLEELRHSLGLDVDKYFRPGNLPEEDSDDKLLASLNKELEIQQLQVINAMLLKVCTTLLRVVEGECPLLESDLVKARSAIHEAKKHQS